MITQLGLDNCGSTTKRMNLHHPTKGDSLAHESYPLSSVIKFPPYWKSVCVAKVEQVCPHILFLDLPKRRQPARQFGAFLKDFTTKFSESPEGKRNLLGTGRISDRRQLCGMQCVSATGVPVLHRFLAVSSTPSSAACLRRQTS